MRSAVPVVPRSRRPYGCVSPYRVSIKPSTATTAGLSSSCLMSVITSLRRDSTSGAGNAGCLMMSASRASTVSKSSTRQVHVSERSWRVTVAASETPRLSSSSAI